ncbi:MAG: DUF4037 domain-containing protein [Candidatus Woesearchaeota archaeon]
MTKFKIRQISGYEECLDLIDKKTKKYTLAYWLHGSRAVDIQHSKSDIDIVFIVEDDSSKYKLIKKLKTFLSYKKLYDYFNYCYFEYWEYKGKEVGVRIYTIKDFNQKVYLFFDSVENVIKNQDFVEHVIINSFPIYDSKNILQKAKEHVLDYPDNIREKVVQWSLNRVKQEVDWWNMRTVWLNVFQEMRVVEPLVSEISRCHYALNKRYYMYSKKHYNNDLKRFLPDIEKELNIVTYCKPERINNKAKREAFTSILNKLNNEFIKQFG